MQLVTQDAVFFSLRHPESGVDTHNDGSFHFRGFIGNLREKGRCWVDALGASFELDNIDPDAAAVIGVSAQS